LAEGVCLIITPKKGVVPTFYSQEEGATRKTWGFQIKETKVRLHRIRTYYYY